MYDFALWKFCIQVIWTFVKCVYVYENYSLPLLSLNVDGVYDIAATFEVLTNIIELS